MKSRLLLTLFLIVFAAEKGNAVPTGGDSSVISSVPASFHFNDFYKKYINAGGIPVISSEKVPDAALLEAKKIIGQMLANVPEIIPKLQVYNVRVAIMGVNELPTDIPEHSDLNTEFPGTNWNTRGRGYGATVERPATTCAEENLLCYTNDRYKGENILVHEFAHTIHQLGLHFLYPGFDEQLACIYDIAIERGLWKNTYAISNVKEYWAEGVQDWFNVNVKSVPANGIHNEISTRQQLKDYDPDLYDLISLYFSDTNEKVGCQAN